jgi:alpha-L-fucosidase 2
MVFGRVAQERLQLNIDTLFGGSPYKADSPDALAALPRIRALIDEGRFAEAEALAARSSWRGPSRRCPMAPRATDLDFIGLGPDPPLADLTRPSPERALSAPACATGASCSAASPTRCW